MKFKRLLIVIVSLVVMASLSGCDPKVWIYSFVDEESLLRGDEEWRPIYDYYSFNNGLILDDTGVVAPHYYNGDFSVTFDFDLNTSPDDTAHIELLLLSNAVAPYEWIGGIFLPDAGSTTATLNFYYRTPSTGSQHPGSIPIAALLHDVGNNTITIDKIGDLLRFTVNGTKIALGLFIEGYDEDVFCPFLSSYYIESSQCIYKKVTIEYKGEQIIID